MKKKMITTTDTRASVKASPSRRPVSKGMKQLNEVLNIIFLAFDLPQSRRGTIFGNKFARRAAEERIEQTGYEETIRILKLYHAGTQSKEKYRPTSSTATRLLTIDWQKIVAFADRMSTSNGRVTIRDQKVKDEIADALSKGGFDPNYKK